MNPSKIILLITAALLACAFLIGCARTPGNTVREKAFVFFNGLDGFGAAELHLANIAEGTHVKSIAFYTDAAVATRHLLFKAGSDSRHIAVCALATDQPFCTLPDEASAAEELVQGELLGIGVETRLMVAVEAIAADVDVFTAAGGKVQDLPATAANVWKVGRSKTAAAADGDKIEIIPCTPTRVCVLAAFTAVSTAAGSDAATTQALANAIKVDLTALRTAASVPSLIVVL